MSSNEAVIRHTLLEDAQALLVAPLFVAFAILLFQHAGLFTGGVVGIAFLIHYLSNWPIGPTLFVINLPFYFLAVRALGWRFTIKTFIAVSLLALYAELLPLLITLQSLDRTFAAVMAGCMAGVGLLILLAASVLCVVFCIIAAVTANNGQYYKYPLTFTFIKD